jgi:DNA-binding CsgD family transcriptional regulator
MGGKVDSIRKHYQPLLSKSLQGSLAQCMGENFPRLGGPRMLQLCAQIVTEHLDQQLRWRDLVSHGQVLYLAYDLEDPPSRCKTTAQTRMVPVILDLVTAAEVEARLVRMSSNERMLRQAIRMCHQAYEQGGLLSNCDLAMLLNTDDTRIAGLLSGYEDVHDEVIPRRATLHDMGSGVTHKGIICVKRYVQGKEPAQIAKETYHTLEAVDRYLGMFDRVRQCRRERLDKEQIAYALNCSIGLVNQYLAIIKEIEKP